MPSDGYCPHCFASLAWEAQYCPYCHTDLTAWSQQPYVLRLIHALQHPLADVRLRAIIALGLQHASEAAPALAACTLREPTNLPQGLAVVEALEQLIPEDASESLTQLASMHGAHAVREAARQVLRQQSNQTR